jgi:hypothetical protein
VFAAVRAQALDSRPDTSRRHVSIREFLKRLNAWHAIPSRDPPLGWPFRRQLAESFLAGELLSIFRQRGACFVARDVIFRINCENHERLSPFAASAAVMTFITPRLEISKRNVDGRRL